MPTRNVNLTPELDKFILEKVESGRYENASEVVRAALRSLERNEREYEAKLAALRAGEIERCFISGQRAQEVLGWTPQTPLREGLAQVVEHVRKTM